MAAVQQLTRPRNHTQTISQCTRLDVAARAACAGCGGPRLKTLLVPAGGDGLLAARLEVAVRDRLPHRVPASGSSVMLVKSNNAAGWKLRSGIDSHTASLHRGRERPETSAVHGVSRQDVRSGIGLPHRVPAQEGRREAQCMMHKIASWQPQVGSTNQTR